MPIEEEPHRKTLTVDIRTDGLQFPRGPPELRLRVPDLLGPGVDGVPSVERDGRRRPTQVVGGLQPAIGMDVSEGAAASDWFDSSTFPVHKGLPPFGSCL
ncbi:MAG: hypothetical protein ACJ736_34685 [Streptomyces sp.]